MFRITFKNNLNVLLLAALICGLPSCATHTNYVKDGGDYQEDSQQCKDQELASIRKNGDLEKPNDLNTPKNTQYVSPFESCMISKGWHTEKTQFRLNSFKMSW